MVESSNKVTGPLAGDVKELSEPRQHLLVTVINRPTDAARAPMSMINQICLQLYHFPTAARSQRSLADCHFCGLDDPATHLRLRVLVTFTSSAMNFACPASIGARLPLIDTTYSQGHKLQLINFLLRIGDVDCCSFLYRTQRQPSRISTSNLCSQASFRLLLLQVFESTRQAPTAADERPALRSRTLVLSRTTRHRR